MLSPKFTLTNLADIKANFASFKYLSLTQKISILFLLILLFAMPLGVAVVAGPKLPFFSRAFLPITPPTPPNPTPTVAPTPTPIVQVITNGSFEIDKDNNGIPDGWTKSTNSTADDKRVALAGAPEGKYVYQMTPLKIGTKNAFKSLFQKNKMSGQAGDTWLFRLWTRTEKVNTNGELRIKISFISRDGSGKDVYASLRKDPSGSYQSGNLVAPQNYTQVVFYLDAALTNSKVYFDDVSLRKK